MMNFWSRLVCTVPRRVGLLHNPRNYKPKVRLCSFTSDYD